LQGPDYGRAYLAEVLPHQILPGHEHKIISRSMAGQRGTDARAELPPEAVPSDRVRQLFAHGDAYSKGAGTVLPVKKRKTVC
jgi:hypothetical protein